uniref:Glycosyl transferase group 1 n=1 Tax=Rubinisphaera brasiliensis (strain ATCC 49424 / DSM 5305 / JCM 21570 / IAM 15109 / NBRC 103401 / IFAM 1448) TaxID=756272 RepID=F0SSF9_RUBBR|nr:glycosyl transferase group 1 [Rubinisphaera brasiliensis DSM 5305]
MRLKIAHLTSAHPWDDVRIFQKQCSSIAAAGHDITLIGVGKHEGPENGVNVIKVSRVNRVLRMLFMPWLVLLKALKLNASLYQLHDPELLPIGVILKLCGKRVVYDAHEDLPKQVLSKHWIPKALRPVVSRLSAFVIKGCTYFFNGVITATPTITDTFNHRMKCTVHNYPMNSQFAAPRSFSSSDQAASTRFVYTGGLSEIRGAITLLDALSLSDDAVRLDLMGSFSPKELESVARKHSGWSHVDFHGWCNRETVAQITQHSLAGLVVFRTAPNHVDALPNKMFEYMAMGLPVIASNFPLWEGIIKDADCGIVVDPESAESLASAMKWMIANPERAAQMGRNGYEAVKRKYCWEPEYNTLESFYWSLCNGEDRNGRRSTATICQSGDCQSSDREAA